MASSLFVRRVSPRQASYESRSSSIVSLGSYLQPRPIGGPELVEGLSDRTRGYSRNSTESNPTTLSDVLSSSPSVTVTSTRSREGECEMGERESRCVSTLRHPLSFRPALGSLCRRLYLLLLMMGRSCSPIARKCLCRRCGCS